MSLVAFQMAGLLLLQEPVIFVPPDELGRGVYSPLFLIANKSGDLRPVIDLRILNLHIWKEIFKMQSLQTILMAIGTGDWIISIDLKDAYFHVPIHATYQKCLWFCVEGFHFQFACLPFDVARVFTKILVVVIALLRTKGVSIYPYQDNIMVQVEATVGSCAPWQISVG